MQNRVPGLNINPVTSPSRGFNEAADRLARKRPDNPAYVTRNFTVIGQPGPNFSCNAFNEMWQRSRLPARGRSCDYHNYLCIEDRSLPFETGRNGKVIVEVDSGGGSTKRHFRPCCSRVRYCYGWLVEVGLIIYWVLARRAFI